MIFNIVVNRHGGYLERHQRISGTCSKEEDGGNDGEVKFEEIKAASFHNCKRHPSSDRKETLWRACENVDHQS